MTWWVGGEGYDMVGRGRRIGHGGKGEKDMTWWVGGRGYDIHQITYLIINCYMGRMVITYLTIFWREGEEGYYAPDHDLVGRGIGIM